MPIDAELHARLVTHWAGIRGPLVAEVDRNYGIYDKLIFKRDRFSAWLTTHGIPWPTLEDILGTTIY